MSISGTVLAIRVELAEVNCSQGFISVFLLCISLLTLGRQLVVNLRIIKIPSPWGCFLYLVPNVQLYSCSCGWIYSHHETYFWVCLCVFPELFGWEGKSHLKCRQHHLKGLSWLNTKRKMSAYQLSSHFVFPDQRCDVTSILTLLPVCLPLYEAL